MNPNHKPSDLAELVTSQLRERRAICVDRDILTALFETMYFASLRTEESRPIAFQVVYLDPDNPDPDPPQNIVNDRWSFVRFASPILMTVQNICKLALASDPRTSSLVVYPNAAGELWVWGLVDQGNLRHAFLNHDSDVGPENAGVFHATIAGIGHIEIYVDYDVVGELMVNRLAENPVDAMYGDPVMKRLEETFQFLHEDGYRI